MREDVIEVAFLITLIKTHCPIQAWLLPWALDDIVTNHPQLKPQLNGSRQIVDASYLGDLGGITCKLDLSVATKRKQQAVFASLTALRVDPRTPIIRNIRRYQKWRMKGLRRGSYDLE